MKRKCMFLIVCVICISCDKSSQQMDTNENLVTSIEKLSSLSMDNLESYCFSNKLIRNQYEIVSDLSSESVKEFYKIILSSDQKGQELSYILADLIKSKLPDEYTDFTGRDLTESEKKIFYLINKSVYVNSIQSLNLRISCIEDVISKSGSLDDNSKMRLLVYCAAIKGIIYTVAEISCLTKGETWEACFKRKLKAMGYIESTLCVIEWPACLAAKAADCIIETQF
jgi:hypothetical protein